MRHAAVLTVILTMGASCGAASPEDVAAEVIALERRALDRWGKGDPQGYFAIFAPDITYFDPTTEKRVDGDTALRAMIAPYTGKIRVDRFDMIDPKVRHDGDIAVLTFNLLSYRRQPDGREVVVARWNATEIYRRTTAGWRISHSHWSYIKPELKTPVTETDGERGPGTQGSPPA